MTNLDSVLKSKDITLPYRQGYGLSSSHAWENWTIKKKLSTEELMLLNWCWRRLESPLESKEIKLTNLKGNQPWTLFGRTDAEALILWPPAANSWLIGNTLMLGKTEGRRSGHQRMRQLDGISDSMDMNSSKLGDAEGQGNLTCCSSWGHKKLDTTWRLNNRHLHQLKYCSPIFWGLYYLRQKFCIFFIPCRKSRTQCLGKRQADYIEENLYLC